MAEKENETLSNFLIQDWLHPIHHSDFSTAGISVEFLRLDRIHPLISGNKWLKLTYWLQKYAKGNYSGLMTCGGPWSNHLHACAYACRLYNMPMVAIVKGQHSLKTATLEDIKDWGSTIEYTNKTLFYNDSFWQEKAIENNLLFIPLGGEGEEGKMGVTEWFNTLPLPFFDAGFVAIGTGTTLQGIAESRLPLGKIYACNPGTGDARLPEKIKNIQAQSGREITLLSSGERFGRASETLISFMEDWGNQTGVALDFVYTAPLCKTLINLCNQKQFAAGSRILVVHTGGIQGNRSLPDAIFYGFS